MFTELFQKLSYKNVDIAGGKGASLGEMVQNKFPIPPGFVVLAQAFDRFLEETDLNAEIEATLKTVNHHEMDSLEKASEKIRDLIRDAKFPTDIAEEILREYKALKAKSVAVRSSATAEDSNVASWAGELESYLNVTEKELLESVKLCWSSLFTPRAITYRFEKNLQDQKVSVAVVVQKMIQSDISGITFTAHPVTNDLSQMVIEAGYGLGEAIVGGMITPDTYIVNKLQPKADRPMAEKTAFEILDKNISEQKKMIVYGTKGTKEEVVSKIKQEKQKITDAQILEIAEICAKIEKHYQKPQDIEWAIEKDKAYITQSRPITTLN